MKLVIYKLSKIPVNTKIHRYCSVMRLIGIPTTELVPVITRMT